MKKNLCLIFALLLCLSLCACGMDRSSDRPGSGMDILPDVTPMVSPDLNDGRVQDQDGIIGNGEGGAGATASPMPSAAPNQGQTGSGQGQTGSGQGQTGSMPTTAPSTSPNP